MTLKEISLDNLNKPLKVLPGMTLTGEIVVGKRSIFSYLAYPIMKTKDEAIREYWLSDRLVFSEY